jgi:nicotinamidase-related amidase
MRHLCDFACFLAKQVLSQPSYTPTVGVTFILKHFSALKANGMAVAGTEGAAIHPAAAARKGEPIVVKHRISPFVGTDWETLLRANGIDTPVLAGVHTSGVVLSTVRHAGDLDYRLVVVRDCCSDPDAEVHAMLLDIVIPKQATVVTMAELGGALPGRSS